MILCIDNYDSFIYNISYVFGSAGKDVLVIRSNELKIQEINKMKPEMIVISPGPGTPSEAVLSCQVIDLFKGHIPILGVCLGHQCIGQAFGGKIIRSIPPVHGKLSSIYHDQQTIFSDMPHPFRATRYHSLIIEKQSILNPLTVSAQTEDGIVMGVRAQELKIEGVQFHPESIATKDGETILLNFIKTYIS